VSHEVMKNRVGAAPSGRLRMVVPALLLASVPAYGQESAATRSSAGGAPVEDSVIAVAGPRYRAGRLERALLGSNYRELWLTPVRVPVLRPDTVAGGLDVLRRGNSAQTRSLLFRDSIGREYFFRSVDKEYATGIPDDLRDTVVQDVIQGRVSAKHPGAAIVIPPLLEAAGVLHAPPRLVVMADHPILGEHRDLFAGMLGTWEERPTEVERGSAFAAFERTIGAERLLERIRESPKDRVNARAYLATRLMDVVVGDWDRHPDQFRWAQVDRGDTRYWLPIPRDRDNAFSVTGGLIARVLRMLRETEVAYGPEYDDPYALIHKAQVLDRRVLVELPLAVWDSVAVALRARLTDEVIARAVQRLPEPWAVIEAEPLAGTLRARRDALPEVAREIYRMMMLDVDVYATDEADRAHVDRLADGSVRVRLTDAEGAVYFERRFLPSETREIRVHLLDGDDRAVVRGPGGGIGIRVVGGAGDDVLEDATDSASSRTVFHDDRGDNRFRLRAGTRVDRRPYEPPVPGPLAEGNPPPPRDWGVERSKFSLRAGWSGRMGPLIGGGPTWTSYGFRRAPYATSHRLAVLFAPYRQRFGLHGDMRSVHTGGRGETQLEARATQLSRTRFFGWGNDTPRPIDPDDAEVWEVRYGIAAVWARNLAPGLRFDATTLLEVTRPELSDRGPAAESPVAGSRPFGVFGLGAGFVVDRRDSPAYPRRGFHLRAFGSAFPAVWGDAPEPFARAGAATAGYLPLRAPLEPTLALRLGGERVWGLAPFQHAAFIGGADRLRGYPGQRFAGTASVYSAAELRARFGHANLRLVRGEVGGILFADGGRVSLDGERSDGWHRAVGGGFWWGGFDRSVVAHLLYARGERHALYAGLGVPF
jgi:hypothetical protein